MSRRNKAEKRKLLSDTKFKSVWVSQFINVVVQKGKRGKAEKIVYKAMDILKEKVGSTEDEVALFKAALEKVKPSLEVKSRRVGGANYQVPIEVNPDRRTALAMRWIIGNARGKVGRSMEEGLAMELSDCFNHQGTTIKKKDDTHRMAEANKAFAHYKW